MKYLLLSVVFLLPLFDWSQVEPKEPGTLKSSVQSVTFGSNNAAWLMSLSEIVKTTDGGATWTLISGNTVGDPTHCSFINELEGWSVTRKGDVWQTHDGGLNWQYIANLVPDKEPVGMAAIKQFLFTDAMNGWVLTPFSLLLTNNGGLSWKEWEIGWANHIQFVNSKLGWIDDKEGTLYKTVDGGKAWIVSGSPKYGELQGCFFLDEQEGWICPVKNIGILHTTNGGKSWTSQSLPTTDLALTSMQFINKHEGWITGYGEFATSKLPDKSVLLHTVDGGKNWEIIKSLKSNESLKKVHFFNQQDGWLFTTTALYRTTDRGNSWTHLLAYPKMANVHNY